MGSFTDLTGQQFNRLTVVGRVENNKQGQARWLCKCSCGGTTEIATSSLKSGHIKSRGCLGRESRIKHGNTPRGNSTPEYKAWQNLHGRVGAKTSVNHKNYAGRGIDICDRWRSFKNFLEDMGLRPTPQHSLDRVNNDLGYSKENCRWATRVEQNRNTRHNRLLTYQGETRCLVEWSELLGIKYATLQARLRKGYTTEQTFSKLHGNSIRPKRK